MLILNLKYSRPIVAALFVSALLFALASSAVAEDERVNPHRFESSGHCGTCHSEEPPELLVGSIETCTQCHGGHASNHPINGHPLGVEVTITTPSPLPLDDKKIVCSTCHDPHGSSPYTSQLRVFLQSICIQCHVGY